MEVRRQMSGLKRMQLASTGPQAVPRPGEALLPYLDGLYSYALVISRSRVEAESLVQETASRAFAAIGSLGAASHVKSSLFTILRSIWLSHQEGQPSLEARGRPAWPEPLAEPAAACFRDQASSFIDKVEQEQVRWAIQQLPMQFREIIVLREYEQLTYEEIASLLQCPASAVMSALAKARAKLRELLLNDRKTCSRPSGTE